jgi:putative ABC transport system substrate-binding protein
MSAPPLRTGRRDLLGLAAGAAAAWPFAACAQQPGRVYRIAVVHPSAPLAAMREPGFDATLFAELRRLGYAEGTNLVVERHSGEGWTDRYAELARTVARTTPDAIFCVTARLALSFKAATATIPVVAVAADPLGFGIAPSLARPGGNITGVVPDAGPELDGKRLELLLDAVPTATRIFFLTLPLLAENVPRRTEPSPLQLAAERLRVAVRNIPLRAPVAEPEYRRAFAVMARARAQGVIISDSAENATWQRLIIGLARAAQLPALYPARGAVEQGGLMSYGVDYPDLYRRAGGYVAQILGGADPGEMPFYRATAFELAVNLRTAAALGLTLPPTLLALADAVIE